MLQHTFVSFSREGSTYTLTVYNLNESNRERYVRQRFTYESDIEAEEGELVIIGDAVYVAPHNKVLYLYDGRWFLRDFVSTTPIVRLREGLFLDGEPAVGFVTFTEPSIAKRKYSGVTALNVDGVNVVFEQQNEVDLFGYVVGLRDAMVGFITNYSVELIDESTSTEIILTIRLTRKIVGNYAAPIEILETPDNIVYEADLKQIGGIVYNELLLAQNLGALFPIPIPQTTISATNVSGGLDAETSLNEGRLEQNQTYAYTARYRYRDGHITQVCFPQFIDTGNNRRYAVIDIDLTEDIDGSFADVEIFRKTGPGEFELVERLRSPQPNVDSKTLRYIDLGKLTTKVLNNRISIWTERHESHAVVRDRYVRANVDFPDLTPDVDADVRTTDTPVGVDQEGVPYGSVLRTYTKVRFDNGQESYFEPTPNVLTTESERILSYQRNRSNGKETAFYAEYNNLPDQETIPFSSNEIYNLNVPSLATASEERDLQDRPVNPHVFFGYRYISLEKIDNEWIPIIVDEELSEKFPSDGRGGTLDGVRMTPIQRSETITTLPERIYVSGGSLFRGRYSVTPFSGLLPYVLKKYETADLESNERVVYELEYINALKETTNRGQLIVRSKTNNIRTVEGRTPGSLISTEPPQYSSEVPNQRFFELDVSVVGIEDKSVGERFLVDIKKVFQPPNSRVYLQLDPESLYGRFTYQDVSAITPRRSFPFALLNVEYAEYSTNKIIGVVPEDEVGDAQRSKYVNEITYDTGLRQRKNVADDIPLIYLGRSVAANSGPLRTGYIKRRFSGYEFYELADYNIYETLVTEGDFAQLQTKFPNQLVWSDTFLEGTSVSGIRNFPPSSFLNISTEHGPIIKIEYVGNNILVFCRNGVAVVSVGEVVTQGTDRQLRVDTSRFLNSEIWILKSTTNISKASIVRYENMIFFADENDVWMYTDSLQNISQGAVPVRGGRGIIDPTNKEYLIVVDGQSWAFNFEINEWVGPYTMDLRNSSFAEGRVLANINGEVVDLNRGNTFAGNPYETIIESVADDLGDSSTDKLYRKFYIQADGDAEFEYAKDNEYFGRRLSEYRNTGETTQIGIKALGAAKRIYWRLKTTGEFVLRMIGFEYTPRNRR